MNQLTEFVVQSKTLNVFTVNNLSIGRQGGAARSVHGVGYEVVMQLMEPYLYRYHHLVCDNYCTSPALCSTLFDKDTLHDWHCQGLQKRDAQVFKEFKVATWRVTSKAKQTHYGTLLWWQENRNIYVHAIPAQVNLYYKSLDDYGDFKE